jgi:copper chaperone CopZ
MTSVTLNVPDISCEHCQRTITSALLPVAGIEDVRVDIPGKQVHVIYDAGVVGTERMESILADEDHPVASIQG